MSPFTTWCINETGSNTNGVSTPFTERPFVVLNVGDKVVPGCTTVPICNWITLNNLFWVAETVEPPISPEAFAVPVVVIS